MATEVYDGARRKFQAQVDQFARVQARYNAALNYMLMCDRYRVLESVGRATNADKEAVSDAARRLDSLRA